MGNKINSLLNRLYKEHSGYDADRIALLPVSGSNRQYYRVFHEEDSVIGVYNPDKRENNAFLTLSRRFKNLGLNVPEVLSEDTQNDIYLLEDLGDISLYSYLSSSRCDHYFPEEIIELYKKVLDELPKFQT